MFKTLQFERNAVGDTATKQLLAHAPLKTKGGKVQKQKSKKNKTALKQAVKKIINLPEKTNNKPNIKTVEPKKKLLTDNKEVNPVKDAKKKTKQVKMVGETKVIKKKSRLRKKKKEEAQDLKFFNPIFKRNKRHLPLRERMIEQLNAARFRYLNEQLYSSTSSDAKQLFQDAETFNAYHEGYRQQVQKWPLNPLDIVIKDLKKTPPNLVVADFGCGDAKLSQVVPQKVHSFDLVAVNDKVTACDMAHVPLANSSVDVAVFCLSLMGTNSQDYLLEANRVLKKGGLLKIAEVESRFSDVNGFISTLKRYNFKNTLKDLSHDLFYFLDFRKEASVQVKKGLPEIPLQPCLYKKR